MTDDKKNNETKTALSDKINGFKNKDINSAMSEESKKIWANQISYGLEKYERRWIKKRSPSTVEDEI